MIEMLIENVIGWAKERQIIPNADPHTQLLKAVSELGGLFDAEIKGDHDGVKDAIGDVLVCLINYAELKGLSLEECLFCAWEELKLQKGTLLPNGVFVKEEE